jgi:hypothetical protein
MVRLKNKTHKMAGPCVTLAIPVLILFGGFSEAGPANRYRMILGEDQAAVNKLANEPYVRQSRAVLFDAKLLALASPLQAGDTIILDLLSNVTYSVVIDTVTRDKSGSLSILGKIAGSKLGTVAITSNAGAVIGTVQDYEGNRLYRIRCVGSERVQYVFDYAVDQMPARQDMPALVPPMLQAQESRFKP